MAWKKKKKVCVWEEGFVDVSVTQQRVKPTMLISNREIINSCISLF